MSGAGTQTAGLAVAGFTPPATTVCEEYDGSSWTAGGSLGTARYRQASSGTLTAGLAFAGTQPPETASTITDEYDGSSWTAGGALGTAITNHAAGGTQTSSIGFGGGPNQAQAYNGTTWSNTPSLATPRSNLGGAGADSTSAVAFGGGPGPSVLATTEEYTVAATTRTFTTS